MLILSKSQNTCSLWKKSVQLSLHWEHTMYSGKLETAKTAKFAKVF